MTDSSKPTGLRNRAFATTSWSVVLQAADSQAPETKQALAELCEAYWYPLYAFVRKKGHDRAAAEDVTQSFFAELLDKKRLQAADRERGRFRNFLLASLNNFMNNLWKKEQALKRGGGVNHFPLDFNDADQRYSNEPFHDATPEKLFERAWALTLLDQTVGQLRQQYAQNGKEELFDRLKLYLGEKANVPYRDVAAELGMSEGAVKIAVFRLRERCGEQLRLQIAGTVGESGDVDQELADLFGALG